MTTPDPLNERRVPADTNIADNTEAELIERILRIYTKDAAVTGIAKHIAAKLTQRRIELEAALAAQPEPPREGFDGMVVRNLAMLVRRLAHRITSKYKAPDDVVVKQACDYLIGEGLQGSILRDAAPQPEPGETREGKGEAPATRCKHGVWIGTNCWQCDHDIPAQPSELPVRELAQEILKPHWPVVRNMDENEAREREVDRIESVMRRAAGGAGETREDANVRAALECIKEVEITCPCGARPESLDTHPHVLSCPVNWARMSLETFLALAAGGPGEKRA